MIVKGRSRYFIRLHYFKKKCIKNIIAENDSSNNFYIQSVSLNGEMYNNNFIKYNAIQNGGTFKFQLDEIPNKNWGSKVENVPFSLSGEVIYFLIFLRNICDQQGLKINPL